MYVYTLYYQGKNIEVRASNLSELKQAWLKIRVAKSHKMNVVGRREA